MKAGRLGKPLFPTTPLDEAFEDLDLGGLSYKGATRFSSFSRAELKRAVRRGEIETFKRGKRTVLLKRSVRMWMAKMLVAQREERNRQEAVSGATHGRGIR
jgi:hypothetical protein